MFALRAAVAGGFYPVASAAAGVLITNVGSPLMDGALASTLGRVVGAGTDRGVALVVLGAGLALGAAAVYLASPPS